MGYRNLTECVTDLERNGMLRKIDLPIDPNLEMAEIQRRVYRAQGPALLFTRPLNCKFPMVSNLFGTLERTRFLFRDALPRLEKLMRLQGDPGLAAKTLEILEPPPLPLARLTENNQPRPNPPKPMPTS